MLITCKIKWFSSNCCELATNDSFEIPIEDKIRLDEKRLYVCVATSTMFQVKITLRKEFPMCVWSRTRSERAESTGRSNSMIPRQKSVRYVIGCFEREEISRSLFLRVYISINCRLSVGTLLRAKKKEEVATTDERRFIDEKRG